MSLERNFMQIGWDKTKSNERQPGGVAIKAENLSFSYGALPILESASFTLNPRQTTCLIGENGSGKTTVLKILARHLEASGAILASKPDYTVEYVPQITPQLLNQEQTAIGFLLTVGGLESLLKKLEYFSRHISDPGVPQEYQDFLEEHDETEIYQARQKAEEILARFVRLPAGEFDKRIGQLSGGQKTRLFLARAFLVQPDLLLLDEPDNNLDVRARQWLLEEIRKFPHTILIVGHKISFVDLAAQKILELRKQDRKIYTYRGNYSNYLEIQAQRKDLEKKERARILKERRELKAAIQRELGLAQRSERGAKKRKDKDKLSAKYKGDRAAQKHQAVAKRLKRQFEKLPEPEKTKELGFRMRIEPAYCSQSVLAVKDLSKAYDSPLFSGVNLEIRKGEHLAIMGPNASGKTTLLKLIKGEVIPDTGQINLGKGVIIGYFPQEQEGLPEMTVLEYFRKTVPLAETDLRRALHGHFLFSEDEVLRRIDTLSAGERARVFFAQFSLANANLLLLDEPTNNLDPKTREAVTALFEDYQGTILVVSHDWEFLERLRVDKTLVLGEGKTKLTYGLQTVI